MNRRQNHTPPTLRTISAGLLFGLFAFSFFQFSGLDWPEWGSKESPLAFSQSNEDGIPREISPKGEIAIKEPPPTVPALNPKTRWVVIDPGHGGIDGGTQGNGMLEKKYALDISKRIHARLKEMGIPVLMTRETDKRIKLSQRSAIANQRNCAAFVSIHLNYSTVSAVSGVETFYSDPKGASSVTAARKNLSIPGGIKFKDGRGKLLADALQERICASTGANNRGIKNRRFLVTMNTHAPAVLIECGFLSHAGESTRLKKETYRQEIAAAVSAGIANFVEKTKSDRYYGITFSDPQDDPRTSPAPPPSIAQAGEGE